mmetsp:Transcript_13204/g.23414  ORF Transcript_13204/g.23414 Transcript_13204/m.23414 type:complete len:360 (-) Transcript_13204:1528-2607(-)
MSSIYPPLYDVETSLKQSKVCVTGVTGYVASAIVERLLASGHIVHATCRNPDAPILDQLRNLHNGKTHLHIFKADLLDDGSFDDAIKGCDAVIHVASPFAMTVAESQIDEKLIRPAVNGTANVLGTVSRSPSVHTVVLTSSVAAMQSSPLDHGINYAVSEKDWNPVGREAPYPLSKTLAEKKAWDLYRSQGESKRWRLVTINPGFVVGPAPILPETSESVTIVRRILSGEFRWAGIRLGSGTVDVRDVAAAHCAVLSRGESSGRYLCVAQSGFINDIAIAASEATGRKVDSCFMIPKPIVWALAPWAVGVSRKTIEGWVNNEPKYDTSKIRSEFGFAFIPLKESVRDMIKAMEGKAASN